MSNREFTNINGIYVCDQTARDNIPTNVSKLANDAHYASETYVNNKIAEASLSGGEVDLSGYVTKETGNANQITFADGQTFQAKLDAGTLKGVGIQSIVTYYRASSSSSGVTKEANN